MLNVSVKSDNHYNNITRVFLLKSCNSSHPNLIKEEDLNNFTLKKILAVTDTETTEAQEQQI